VLVRYSRLIAIIGLAYAPTSCVIDTVPLPEDRCADNCKAAAAAAGINASAIYYTEEPPVLLVGAEGAVRGNAEVWVSNLNSANNWQTATTAAANGSFNLPLYAQTGDQIEVSMVVGGAETDSIVISLAPPSASAYQANDDLANRSYDTAPPSAGGGNGECADGICGIPGVTLVITAPDILGLVSVSGPPGSVAENIIVVVANLTLGPSTTGIRHPDGSFDARVPGRSGDQLAIFAVDLASSNAGSAPITVFVP
jgi:hypothetical protein